MDRVRAGIRRSDQITVNHRERHLEAIDGEETAKNALLETSAENYHIVLFIHGRIRSLKREKRGELTKERREWIVGEVMKMQGKNKMPMWNSVQS
jgi:hypothetical protein